MEETKEIINDEKELSSDERQKLAVKIAGYFTQWDSDRQSQIDNAKKIMKETYLQNDEPAKDWHSNVKLNGLYNIKRARKSKMWLEMWSNSQQMFEVRGTDEQTEKTAKQQKAAIVDSLEKMNIGKQYDNAIDNLYDIGEIVFKVDWEKQTKIVKRQKKGVGFVLQNLFRKINGAGFTTSMQDIEIPYYENARVESISPLMFVFDHSMFKFNNEKSWDSCIKIYKRFDTLENIKSNPLYKLTSDQLLELETEQENQSVENKEIIDKRELDEFGSQYSILFAHGDFKYAGKVYKNYIAEIVAGKYLVRFEENSLYINPFIMCALEFDPKTKRGISPLQSIYSMSQEVEKLTNVAFDVQKLTATPAAYADEDLFGKDVQNSDGTIPIAPGKIIKLKSAMVQNLSQVLQPIIPSASGIDSLLGLLDQKIADLSSVSSVMYGNIEDQKRTATELTLANQGSSAQTSKEIDIINQDLTLPMIKKVAELLAMFKDGSDFVYIQEKGKNVEYKITNEIRQAQYGYYYEDRNAIADQKARFKQVYDICVAIGQNAELFKLMNWKEIITTAFENTGFDNTDKFFKPETPTQEFSDEFAKLPEPIQSQLLPMFKQATEQTLAQQQQQQQIQQMEQEAQKQVEMQVMREQARAQYESNIAGALPY